MGVCVTGPELEFGFIPCNLENFDIYPIIDLHMRNTITKSAH